MTRDPRAVYLRGSSDGCSSARSSDSRTSSLASWDVNDSPVVVVREGEQKHNLASG